MAKVVLKGIKKIYSKDVVVHNFNIEIKDKEFVVLVGPSGCGKSTTLRMIAGLEEITDGELYIGDLLVNDIAPKDRDIAMVFQNYALYPHMTVYDNMAFALELRKEKKAEIDKKVKQAATILDITELLDRKPKELSGGQRQRVAIGRAIVRFPQVFLMDEPLSNLDAKLRNLMRAEIIKLRQSVDTTFIYVTHDQIEAMTLGDRIVIMKDGFIQQIGTPQEVFYHPANLFVAGFIGSPQMNFFNVQLIIKEKDYYVKLGNTLITVNEKTKSMLADIKKTESEIILGIRPEHISLTSETDPESIPAIVDVSEMMGSEIYLHVNSLGNDCVIRVQTMDLPERYQNGFMIGDCIYYKFNCCLAHMFDTNTHNNLFEIKSNGQSQD